MKILERTVCLVLLMPESRSWLRHCLQTQICFGRETAAQGPVLLKAETVPLKHPNSLCPMAAGPLKWALNVSQLVTVTSFSGGYSIRSP